MGTSTRPPGPRTGLVTPKCYAAALVDCDGNPTNAEHYMSLSLLNRFGARFFVEGVPWLDSPRELTASTMVARVLCRRHNNALSPLDTMMGNFYDVLAGAREGREVGVHLFEGEDFERWALKVLLGRTASGNVRWHNGSKERPEIPLLYLRILFGEEDMPDGCGFFYVGDPVDGLYSDGLNVAINTYAPQHTEPGAIFGVTVNLLGFQFITSVTARLEVAKQRIWHRPGGFQLGNPERGRVRLRWKVPSSINLILKMPSFESK
jgi:hypothetical protein